MSVETDRLLGTDLAGFRLESVIGRGGMGVVYLAQDLRLKRRVALKLVAPELAADARFRERFLREAELAASLDHSHIVPVHAAGETDGQLWIAMRYVQGTDLKSLLEREGPLEPARAVELCWQVGEALDAAHEHGLVHRDVKPANVLVTQEGGAEHCYLADFGLARSPDMASGPVSGTHLSGTVDYTAPEQIAREPADQRADVYSLGCVLYECLAGQPPFKRQRPVATLFAHANEAPPSLHEHRPELPEPVDQVIATGMAKEPAERYATCSGLVAAAREALGLTREPTLTRRALLVSAGGALVLGSAAAAPAILLTRGNGAAAAPKPLLPLTGDSIVRIDPATGSLTDAVPVRGASILAVGPGAVWVASATEPVLTRIDPRSNTVVETVDTSELGVPGFIAAGEGAVWVGRVSSLFDRLWRYDPRSASLAAIPADIAPAGVTTGGGSVWVAGRQALIARIDAKRGEILWAADLREASRCDCFPGVVTTGEGAVWAIGGGESTDTVFRLDPQTRQIVTVSLDEPATDIAVGGGSAWVTNLDDDAVSRIDAATNSVTSTIRVGRIPSSVAVGDGSVWVASSRDRTVTRVDPRTADIATISVGGRPEDIAVGEGSVWVAVDVR
jgi:YVTN family beta-propeller protein